MTRVCIGESLFVALSLLLCQVASGQPAQPPPPPAPTPNPAPAPRPPAPPAPSEAKLDPSQSTRIRLDVFTVQLSREQGAAFSLDDVRAGGLAAKDILAALGKLGDAGLMYRFDERIDLARRTSLTTGDRVPIIQNLTVAAGGKVTPSVTYERIGCVAEISGRWDSAGNSRPMARVALRLSVSDVSQSSVSISEGVRLPAFTEVSIDRELWVKDGEPALTAVLRARKSETTQVDGYNACVVRLEFDRIAPNE